jgi:hypothetical protein
MAQDANTVSTAEIRTQIERTRAELGQTIDAIQDRLSPRRVMHETKEKIADATIGRAKRLAHRVNTAVQSSAASPRMASVLDHARHNPSRTTLIAAAVGAVIVAGLTRARRPRLAGSLGGLALSLAVATLVQQRTRAQQSLLEGDRLLGPHAL